MLLIELDNALTIDQQVVRAHISMSDPKSLLIISINKLRTRHVASKSSNNFLLRNKSLLHEYNDISETPLDKLHLDPQQVLNTGREQNNPSGPKNLFIHSSSASGVSVSDSRHHDIENADQNKQSISLKSTIIDTSPIVTSFGQDGTFPLKNSKTLLGASIGTSDVRVIDTGRSGKPPESSAC